MSSIYGFLNSIEIFSLLKEGEIREVHDYLEEVKVVGESVLFRQGDEGKELYIVRDGSVATSISLPDGKSREIAVFKSGDFFGEMCIFEEAPRSATCTAREDSVLFRLHQRSIFKIIEDHPETAQKIMYRMLNITTQRLRNTGDFLFDMVQWGDKARKRAITDEMTGVYNRRFLDDSLHQYVEESRKNGEPLVLVMVDLDYFRQINELYGHETGDGVIRDVVEVFKRRLRDKNIIARYGGDEFTFLLPGAGKESALAVCDAIRTDVERLDTLARFDGAIKRVTISQGLASFPESAVDIDSLKKKADTALYRAKEEGRNRVVCM
ncbi:MAG TPA: GGDEF domain-containing protein [Spirochaetota bacterium]|nr:GGDEF domain-containing protein [Spirochaetota bacterium]